MANYFDQFDPSSSGGNYFDQFDKTKLGTDNGGVLSEIKSAASDALSGINEAFNPYSATNTARMNAERNASPFDISGEIGNLGTVAKGALSVPALVASPLTGAARGTVGRAYDALAPQFTPEQQAQLAASGIHLPSGREAVDTALMALRPSGANPAGIINKPAPLPSSVALKTAAKSVYDDPSIKSLTISPDALNAKVTQAGSELLSQGFRPTPESAPATFRELNNLMPPAPKPVDYWTRVEAEMNGLPIPTETPAIKSVSVDDLRAARRVLNKTAGLRDAQGKPTPDAAAASQAIGHIDDLLSSMTPDLATANANYAAAKATDTLDFRRMKAERRAAKTGSGSNIENTMRQEADKIPTRGLTQQEQSLLDQIVMGTKSRNALRKVGKLGFGDGLSTMYHAALTLPTGGMNLPVGVAATVARKVGEGLTRSQLNQLSEMIRARSPLARQAPPLPVSPPNPLLAGGLLGQIPQGLLRPMLGLAPSYADQKQ